MALASTPCGSCREAMPNDWCRNNSSKEARRSRSWSCEKRGFNQLLTNLARIITKMLLELFLPTFSKTASALHEKLLTRGAKARALFKEVVALPNRSLTLNTSTHIKLDTPSQVDRYHCMMDRYHCMKFNFMSLRG